MERSAKNHSNRGKFVVPALVLFGALLCISWLGSNGKRADDHAQFRSPAGDTVPPDKLSGARYTRKSIITIDENGQPHEQIVEGFEGDEKLTPLFQKVPDAPDVSAHPTLPPGHDPMLQWPDDTIPPAPFGLHEQKEWEEFARSFDEDLIRRFERFGFHADTLFRDFGEDYLLPHWNELYMPDHALRALEELERSHAFENLEEELRHLEQLNTDRFRDFGERFDFHQEHLNGYEDNVREELVEDGYLSEDEPIRSLEWNDKSFKVNGKSIKKEHQEKYRKLNQRFFGGDHVDKVE